MLRYKLITGFLHSSNSLKEISYLDNLNNKTHKKNIGGKFNIEVDEGTLESTDQVILHKELFWEATSSTRLIYCHNIDFVDFRFVMFDKRSEPFVVTIVNNSNEKLLLKWISDNLKVASNEKIIKSEEKIISKAEKIKKEKTLKNLKENKHSVQQFLHMSEIAKQMSVFTIYPEEIIVPKKGSYDFKVYFTPSKPEYYFYANLTCCGFILTSKIIANTGLDINNFNMNPNSPHNLKAVKQFISNSNSDNDKVSIDPPIPLKISVVGHSFPPSTQIYIPMAEVEPKELIFPYTTINQSQYLSFKIKNTTDTPLFFKFLTDPSNVFRLHPKSGLIDPKEFQLICAEFCPKDIKSYRFPLKIIFNHDVNNLYQFNLEGECVDPYLEVNEGIKEVYFAPSFTNISTKKNVNVLNKSPIKVNCIVNIIEIKQIKKKKKQSSLVEEMSKLDYSIEGNNLKQSFKSNIGGKKDIISKEISQNISMCQMDFDDEEVEEETYVNPANVKLEPSYFDLEGNQSRNIEITLTPLEKCNFVIKIQIITGRIYDPLCETMGIFNPGCLSNQKKQENLSGLSITQIDRREHIQNLLIVGSGADGVLKVDPLVLDFGTVKVGFQEKKTFSIYNTSLCNFYVQLQFQEENLDNIFSFDFKEGLIHSLCKKTISITYKPITRYNVDFNIIIYSVENIDQKSKTSIAKTEKACIVIKANGNYPLIKIVDVRNNLKSTTTLWKNFNCNEANEELSKELTEEEINFMNSEKANKKIQDFYDKLKCVKFNFGKHLLKKEKNSLHNHSKFEVYLTLKNEGGVDSEFFFKFPDDISIKREIWMDPDEPTSEGTKEYHVLKHKIFEIWPRKFKLKKYECCNIKFTYNIVEERDHYLRVIFQIVNGKPLVFELCAQTHLEREGILSINNPELDFGSIPMGNMIPMTSKIELHNIGGLRLKYALDESVVDEYNLQFEGFPIFKIENGEGNIGQDQSAYLVISFKPLTTMRYNLIVPIDYLDDVNQSHRKIMIKLSGTGYHPLETQYSIEEDNKNFLKDLIKLPKNIIFNNFDDKIIYKCGLSIDEINFGIVEDGKQSVQTFILFNYSSLDTLDFNIKNCGFCKDDEIKFYPESGKLEPNSHLIIKATLFCRSRMLTYIGEAQVEISWKKEEFKENFNSQITVEKQNLYLRIIKRAMIKDFITAEGKLDTVLPPNTCFVEHIINEFFKDIICNSTFDQHLTNNMDNQPLKLYHWTTNEPTHSHSEVRKEYIDNAIKKAKNNDISFGAPAYKKPQKQGGRDKTESKIEEESKDPDIEEKYTKELVSKFGYSSNEMEEKMLMVNEDTKKLVFDILENTVYNIIQEAVCGETDLSEPTKIIFIKR